MKKRLNRQELTKIKQLLESTDESNHQLAKQLLKGAKNLHILFLTYLFNRAYFSANKHHRKLFKTILSSTEKKLTTLGKNKFSYVNYSTGESQLCTTTDSFYDQMKEILFHPLLDAKSVIAFFNQGYHEFHKSRKLPKALLFLALELGLLSNKKLSKIKELNLLKTNTFPKGLETLLNLKTIRTFAKKATLNKFPNPFPELPRLEYLSIDITAIEEKELPLNFFKHPNLKDISLTACNIKGNPHFWESLLNNTRIKMLDLSRNPLTSIPDDIQKLKNLKYLGLSQINGLLFKNISPEVFRLPKLQILRLNSYKKQQKNILAQIQEINPYLQVDFHKPFILSKAKPPDYLREDY
ncbi:MAG: hypothetical protein GY810_16310 [Aureispira sp.]|nr:hypothetical protein [Aureispira sp.]